MKTKIILTAVAFSLGVVGGGYAADRSFDGDIDADLDVDAIDFSILVSYWLYGNCYEPDWCGQADLDQNHEVNLFDFFILARDWLQRIMTLQSHATHTEYEGDSIRGPHITCSDCHDMNNLSIFQKRQRQQR